MLKNLFDIECEIFKKDQTTIYKFPTNISIGPETDKAVTCILLYVRPETVAFTYEINRYVRKQDRCFTNKGSELECISFKKNKFRIYYMRRKKRARKYNIYNFTKYGITSLKDTIHNRCVMAFSETIWKFNSSGYSTGPGHNKKTTKLINSDHIEKVINSIIRHEVIKHGYENMLEKK